MDSVETCERRASAPARSGGRARLALAARMAGRALASLAVALFGLWGCGALWYQARGGPGRILFIALWGALSVAAAVAPWRRAAVPRMRRAARAGYALAAAALLGWWMSLAPSNDRVWADDVSRMLGGTVQGPVATLRNVRDFDWRSESSYTPRWEERRYDLDQLVSVDMILSSWGMPAIAHTLVSFGFADGGHVAFSVEIRKEAHEQFSEIGGFFKQFELSLVAADERDIVYVRTAVRGERVALYPVRMPRPAMRTLFLSYVATANALQREPRFYHTLFANCTTLVYQLVRPIVGGLPLDYRLLLSGYLPEYLYEHGGLDRGVPLAVLRREADITGRAALAGNTPGFSRAIRAPFLAAGGAGG